MSISQRLRTILDFYKKNASEFSDYINVSRNTVARVTKEEKSPGIKLLQPLADMGININWLLTGKGDMFINKDLSQVNKSLPDYKTAPKTFQDAIKQFYEASEDYKESWEKLLHEKDLRLEEKERIIQTKDEMIKLLKAKSQS